MTYFQSNLRHLKSINNYTHKDLQNLSRISKDMFELWVSNTPIKVTPDANQLKRISDTFSVSIDYLISEDLKKITENEMLANYYDV